MAPGKVNGRHMFTTTITQELAAKMTPGDAQKLIKGLCIPEAGIAVATLAKLCANERINPMARIAAAIALLDRGFGKPEQMQTIVTPGNGRSGVMMVPSGSSDEDEWERRSSAHHEKMLTLPGPRSPDPKPSS